MAGNPTQNLTDDAPPMADIVSPAVRSRMMAGIKGKNTAPEVAVRSGLFALGLRYRLHDSSLPGRPDLVFRRYRAVVFVHGCFWHGHTCSKFKWPKQNREFWKKKILGNRKRDLAVRRQLAADGWRIACVWECALVGKDRPPINNLWREAAEWLRRSDSRFLDIPDKTRRDSALRVPS